MNRVPRLDFAHSAADSRRRRRIVLAVLGMLLGLELGLLAWQSQDVEAVRSQLIDEQLGLQKRLKKTTGTVISKELSSRLAAAQGMVSSLSIPWEGLLSALETAHQGKVIIESIRPEVSGHRVEIGAQAANFAEIPAFIARLSATRVLQQVVLLSETPIAESQGSIRFILAAVWVEEP